MLSSEKQKWRQAGIDGESCYGAEGSPTEEWCFPCLGHPAGTRTSKVVTPFLTLYRHGLINDGRVAPQKHFAALHHVLEEDCVAATASSILRLEGLAAL